MLKFSDKMGVVPYSLHFFTPFRKERNQNGRNAAGLALSAPLTESEEEVKVYPTTDDPERFLDLDEVILDAGREQIVLKIQNVKFFKNMVILKFKGYDNINDIEKYKGRDLLIRRDQAVDLDEDEYFITDLVGLKVVAEDGTVLGVLKEVMPTGANDVYIVSRKDGKELLLPAIKECIRNVDLEQGVMNIHLMDGLLDL